MVELVKAHEGLEGMYHDFMDEWLASGETIVPYAVKLQGMDFPGWLAHTRSIEQPETCPAHLVPASTYFLVQDSKRVLGAVNIRHRLNDYLLRVGGHIGYGVRPSERRQGHATRMLSMALPIARLLGIARVLVTCDKSNVGSARTILRCGGVLESEVQDEGDIVQRYWIAQ